MALVSVVLPARNGMPLLQEAVESILSQSFANWELIIVDDGSTDATAAYLSSLDDERVRVLTNRKSLGLSASLNKGIKAAHGKYIARMDHDDISLRERLANQHDFLEANPKVDILGTWAKTQGLTKEQIWRYPTQDEDIRSELIFNSNLVHSSVMLRAAKLKRYKLAYDPKIARAQDYELWSRFAGRLRFANLDQVLLHYRIHAGQVGRRHGREQQAVAAAVRGKLLTQLGLKPSATQHKLHNAISMWQFPASKAGLGAVEAWLSTLLNANDRLSFFPKAAFRRALEERWWHACRASVSLGRVVSQVYASSPLAAAGWADRVLLWAKAELRELRA
jgi:glycosyltransferase involved in cell wall biosynthesis